MDRRLFLAGDDGLTVLEQSSEGWEKVGRVLEGQPVTTVSASKYAVLAGTREGVFVSRDEGRSWEPRNRGLAETHVRWLSYHVDDPWLAFAGTEPAAIFVSEDGAESWRACPEVAELRDGNGWYLPYSPEAGCVRGFAFHGLRGYAAVEQGGLLRTDDGGLSWHLAGGSTGDPEAPVLEGRIHTDVHSVTTHPSSPDLVLAPTGGGLYWSEDGGQTWTELYDCYCRAAWIDPQNAQHIVFGPAEGVDSKGRIMRSTDGGETWEDASSGLSVPWPQHMVERVTQIGDELWAVLSNGDLVAAPVESLEWRPAFPKVGRLAAVAALGA